MSQPATLHARTKAFAKDIPAISWWHIISTALLLALSVTCTLPFVPLWLRAPCSVLTALLLVRLFVIFHDHQHRAILPKSKLANVLMRIFGMCFLCPSTVWRRTHDDHHAHNCQLRIENIGSFPIMTRERFQSSPAMDKLKYLLMRHPLTLLFGYATVFFYSLTLLPAITSPRRHWDAWPTMLIHLGLAAFLVVCYGWLAYLLTMGIPFLIASALGAYLFYAQHNFPGVILRDEDGWTFEGAALDSSSYLKTGPILSWFTGNIGYHHIHHLNHHIPFYRLPEVYRAIPELRAAKTTTLLPWHIVACLRLKVWCVASQRMVTLGDISRN
ncbi:MAG TPA: fatty acid desaturase [Candidatus Acidoferrales bacterium]|nr:fatty acid desaturase [Candidatus Acidoferrales bacterium]